jgi:hypothetical protein
MECSRKIPDARITMPLVEINILVDFVPKAEFEIQSMKAWESTQPSWQTRLYQQYREIWLTALILLISGGLRVASIFSEVMIKMQVRYFILDP